MLKSSIFLLLQNDIRDVHSASVTGEVKVRDIQHQLTGVHGYRGAGCAQGEGEDCKAGVIQLQGPERADTTSQGETSSRLQECLATAVEIRHNFWSVRVAEHWNNLTDCVKEASTVNMSKNSLDNLKEMQGRPR